MSVVAQGPLPEGVEAHAIDIPGGPLAVLDAEAHGSPRGTVVLVPGFTGSKEDFQEILVPLAEAGLRVVALDQRGQHESPGPDDPAAYTTEALAADLLHLVATLGTPVHLVGHSFGGLVSRAAVLKDPSPFLSLTLMDSGPQGLTGPRADVLPFMRAILLEGGLEAVWDASQALGPNPDKPMPSEEAKAFLRTRMLAGAPAALLGMADSLTTEPDRCEELAQVDLPRLVLYGEKDDAWSPAQQDAMAERIDAPVVVVPDAWHSPAAENPALTAQVLRDFFRQVAAT
ncbi:MAG: Alpha/beta hydrolase [Frankiales bacterium]|nr:Alpha/beta hydrolase [Frankiales bacterium]